MTTTVSLLPPAMAALERAREAWENAGRPGPDHKQLVIPTVATIAARHPAAPTNEGSEPA